MVIFEFDKIMKKRRHCCRNVKTFTYSTGLNVILGASETWLNLVSKKKKGSRWRYKNFPVFMIKVKKGIKKKIK